MGADTPDAARTHRETRSQGAIRERDARALTGYAAARCSVRAIPDDREPAPRAVGHRIAGVPESSAARTGLRSIHSARARTAGGNSADRRHLLSVQLDGKHSLGTQTVSYTHLTLPTSD